MGIFDDITGAISSVGQGVTHAYLEPARWATGQILGGQYKKPFDEAENAVNGITTSIWGPGAGQEMPGAAGAPAGSAGIPDLTGKWETLAQDLQGKQTKAAMEGAVGQQQQAAANLQNQLAMRGGLSAGSRERIGADAMRGVQDQWGKLNQSGMLGAADIRKQALEKEQELALKKAMGQDMAAAMQASAPKDRGLVGNLLGGLGL